MARPAPQGVITILGFTGIVMDKRPGGEQVIVFKQQDNQASLSDIHKTFEGLLFTSFNPQEWSVMEMELVDLVYRGDGVWIKVRWV